MSKLLLTVIAVLAVGMVGAACQPSASAPVPKGTPPVEKAKGAIPDWQKRWDDVLSRGKLEGQVMVYGAQLAPRVRDAMTKGFQARHGINVEIVVGSNAEIAARWEKEKNAGISIADTFMTGSAITTLTPMGALASLEPYLILPEVLDPKAWPEGKIPYLYKDKSAIPLSSAWTSYVVINTDMVKGGQLASYRDLLKPEWKEKVAINDPTVPGAAAGFAAFMLTDAFGPEEGRQFLRQLAATKPVITKDVRLLVEWVARGKYPIGIGAYQSIVSDFKSQGAPIDFNRFAEGGSLNPAAGVIHVSVKPPHPNAATVFINWLLTAEGQKIYASADASPAVRVDVKVEGVDPIRVARPNDKAFWTDENFYLTQGQAMRLAREIFVQ